MLRKAFVSELSLTKLFCHMVPSSKPNGMGQAMECKKKAIIFVARHVAAIISVLAS